jgi:hypothetical protein
LQCVDDSIDAPHSTMFSAYVPNSFALFLLAWAFAGVWFWLPVSMALYIAKRYALASVSFVFTLAHALLYLPESLMSTTGKSEGFVYLIAMWSWLPLLAYCAHLLIVSRRRRRRRLL